MVNIKEKMAKRGSSKTKMVRRKSRTNGTNGTLQKLLEDPRFLKMRTRWRPPRCPIAYARRYAGEVWSVYRVLAVTRLHGED